MHSSGVRARALWLVLGVAKVLNCVLPPVIAGAIDLNQLARRRRGGPVRKRKFPLPALGKWRGRRAESHWHSLCSRSRWKRSSPFLRCPQTTDNHHEVASGNAVTPSSRPPSSRAHACLFSNARSSTQPHVLLLLHDTNTPIPDRYHIHVGNGILIFHLH